MKNRRFVFMAVPVFNNIEGLRRCLAALEGQPNNYELAAVDRASDKGQHTLEVVAAFTRILYTYEPV